RGGQNWGNRALFPRHDKAETLEDVVFAFLSQFYEDKLPPRRILLDRQLPEMDLLEEALSTRAGHRVSIETPRRGKLAQLVELATRNASDALDRRMIETSSQAKHLGLLAERSEERRVGKECRCRSSATPCNRESVSHAE